MTDDRIKVFTSAQKMGINKKAAVSMRVRYLKQKLSSLLQCYTKKEHPITLHWIADVFEEIAYLKKKAVAIERKPNNNITDLMIETARNTDVRGVVDFKRGSATAWCHEDKRPSLYYASRINRAICPVCDKKFNAVDVLMERDGYTFYEAVRSLQ